MIETSLGSVHDIDKARFIDAIKERLNVAGAGPQLPYTTAPCLPTRNAAQNRE